MQIDEVELGLCCQCGRLEGVRNVVALPYDIGENGGWGCFTCGLPTHGAIAVLCDECLDDVSEENPITWYCIGHPHLNHRGLVAELDVPFEHDMRFHETE